MGVIVAFGVLLDAIVVRSILVPAIALSAGDRIWWPLPMARIRSLAGRQTRREELRTEDAIAG
jgi:RND superfamily putative drug exporter